MKVDKRNFTPKIVSIELAHNNKAHIILAHIILAHVNLAQIKNIIGFIT